MAITEALIKKINTFDLQKISESEEDYIAWQVADTLFNSTVGDVGTLSTSSSGNTSVGAHTNTIFDQAIGTHPATSLTQTTTTTNIYQNFGGDATVNNVYPIININNTLDFKSTNSSELDGILDRLIEKVFGDSYFNYRLGATTPAGYTLYISSVFSDTRTDGTSVVYNLYKKNLPAKPTTIRPMRSVGADFRTMTDTEIKECFAQRIRNKISDTSIGSYKVNPSATGAPSGGTWIAAGSAIDTRHDTADQNYTSISTRDSTRISTRDSTQNFTRISQTAFSADYIGTFTRSRDSTVFAEQFAGNYTRTSVIGSVNNFAGDYTGNFIGNFVGNYTGNYTRVSTRTRATTYTRTSTRTRIQYFGLSFYNGSVRVIDSRFQGDIVSYVGNYVGNFVGNFLGNYTGDYEGTYSRDSTRDSTTLFTGNYEGGFEGNYEGNYAGAYDGIDYTSSFIGNYDGIFTGNYIADYEGNYEGNFIGDYTGNYIGNYEGNYAGSTLQATSSEIEIYTLYVRIA
jgi:hypothetical protein